MVGAPFLPCEDLSLDCSYTAEKSSILASLVAEEGCQHLHVFSSFCLTLIHPPK